MFLVAVLLHRYRRPVQAGGLDIHVLLSGEVAPGLTVK